MTALRIRSTLGLAVVAALASAAPASGHLVTTGLGPVYDGISHLFVSPGNLLTVLALGLLGGMSGPAAGRRMLFLAAAAWPVGACVGAVLGPHSIPAVLPAASLIVVGGLVAADRRWPPGAVAALGSAVAFAHGWIDGAAVTAAQRDLEGVAGIAISVFVVLALVSATVLDLRMAVARVAIRVLGSWLAAIGLLMLGWQLRPA